MKYRKIALIEAIVWTGKNLVEITEFTQGSPVNNNTCKAAINAWDTYRGMVREDGLFIETLEGKLKAQIGDYIIKGIKGECYPCKPDIFKITYEEVL